MNTIIRNAVLSDLDDISKIELQCFPILEAGSKKQFEQRLKTYPESFFVAEIDSNIVGYIHGASTNSLIFNDDFYKDVSFHNSQGFHQLILGLCVIENYRKNKIAEKLILHMTKFAKIHNKKYITLTCKYELKNYYEKFGYINQGISKSNLGNTIWYDMVLNI